ncbi:MAG: hypothetical protein IKK43_04365 [Clostridia bacterium]|nr:hypothetical protein [Clostridia bacterium]
MDNASKALIMVGGVLITVLVISLAMYMLTSARGVADASDKRLLDSQKVAFNSFFEYYPSQIRGIDVYNIIGKIEDINKDGSSLGTVTYNKDDVNKEMVDDTPEFLHKYSYTYGFTNGLVSNVTFTKLP